jgi:hypothetical protein
MKRATGLLALLFGVGLFGCRSVSRDEVLRVASPDDETDAIVYETDCGAVCSYGYEVWVSPKGHGEGEEVARFDAALRSKQAWGVTIKWVNAETISVEYLRADSAKLLKKSVATNNRTIEVSLHEGVEDPRAPSGSMRSNRR